MSELMRMTNIEDLEEGTVVFVETEEGNEFKIIVGCEETSQQFLAANCAISQLDKDEKECCREWALVKTIRVDKAFGYTLMTLNDQKILQSKAENGGKVTKIEVFR